MLIKKSDMMDIYHTALNASPEHIKSLEQPERKALKVMLSALKSNNESIESDHIQTGTLAEIKHKFTLPPQHAPSNFIMKIIKGALNILGLRVSSSELQKDISFIQTYGNKEKFKVFQRARSFLKNNLEKNPVTKDEIIERTLDHAKNDTQSIVNGHSKQFVTDFTRGGPVVTIVDSTKGTFQGKKIGIDTKGQDHLHYHTEGLSKVFNVESEEKWLHLAEASLGQSSFNSLGMPIVTLGINEVTGMMYSIKLDGKAQNIEGSGGDRTAKIEVVRDKYGNIQKLNIHNTMITNFKFDPSGTFISELKSTLTYTVLFNEDGDPKIQNLSTEHVFAETQSTLLTKETKTPGFHPLKEVETSSTNDIRGMVDAWKKELSELKLSISKSTPEKVDRLEKRIEDMDKAVNNPGRAWSVTLEDKAKMEEVIFAYKKYLEALKTNEMS